MILAGIDCEYGLLVEGRTASDQVEDSERFVRAYPGESFFGWDYRFENPRNDLRGFQLKNLAIDPHDAAFDVGRAAKSAAESRADQVLTNGARLYNDHGHPEYATPESFSIFELARFDQLGEEVMRQCQSAFESPTTLYKNNVDYHGACYGTHESYLAPRNHSVDEIMAAVLPMLIIRQILTGAGKVGSEEDKAVEFQLSQRADFIVEIANAETLWRRPIFNTRDEPHADPSQWIRLHMISGDANMNPRCTALKIGLVKLALTLLEAGAAPHMQIKDPVKAFKSISRDLSFEFKMGSITAYQVFEQYFTAYEALSQQDQELDWVVNTSRTLLGQLSKDWDEFRKSVDWAAKLHLLRQVVYESDQGWRDPALQAYDLEYSNVSLEDGLFYAMEEMGEVETTLPGSDTPPSRALARGRAVQSFRGDIASIGWRSITFNQGTVELRPDVAYPSSIETISDVETFITTLRAIHDSR